MSAAPAVKDIAHVIKTTADEAWKEMLRESTNEEGGGRATLTLAPGDNAHADVLWRASLLLGDACTDSPSCEAAVAGGAVPAIVKVLDAYPHFAELHECGVWALRQLCEHRAVEERDAVAQTCIDANACPALCRALGKKQFLSAGPQQVDAARTLAVREKACAAIASVGTASPAAKLALSNAGAVEAVVSVLKEHRKVPSLVGSAAQALAVLCSGGPPLSEAETASIKDKAAAAGVIPVLVWALRKHKKIPSVVDPGRSALIVVCYTEKLQSEALKAGANPSWSPRASHRADTRA